MWKQEVEHEEGRDLAGVGPEPRWPVVGFGTVVRTEVVGFGRGGAGGVTCLIVHGPRPLTVQEGPQNGGAAPIPGSHIDVPEIAQHAAITIKGSSGIVQE